MPRNAKEKIEELNTSKTLEKVTSNKSKTSKSKVSTKKEAVSKEKETSKKATAKRTSRATSKNNTKIEKKVASKSVTKKASTSSRKNTNTKNTKKKTATSFSTSIEYYDLPFRYNQTVVKILAQTPKTLFIYWDISDDDRKSYEKNFGNNFFENTKPVLVITNRTMNYTFEVEINDFANSWYLHINDADCDYKVELGRRFITNSNSNISIEETSNSTNYSRNDYIYIASSNEIETPNNHILFDKLGKSVFFKNIKTNFTEEKFISSISYIQNMGKIYNIYDLYKEIYKDELNTDEFGFDLPSSNSSSNFMK